jgi:hypothetical protein
MGLGNAKPETSKLNRCDTHDDRFAAVTVNGVGKCWECYLPPDQYRLRIAPDFYAPEKTE